MPTRRHFLGTIAAGAAAALGVACGESSAETPVVISTVPPTATPPPLPTATIVPTPLPTPTALPAASLEQKIGQMILMGFRGFSVTPGVSIFDDIAAGRVGGVVLFDYDPITATQGRNIESPKQLAKLTADLQSLTPRHRLLISTDQEGGLVARLKPANGFPATLSAEELGDLDDLAATQRYAADMAANLAASGINLNLAPVVDVNVNPANPVIGSLGRSFSSDPKAVAQQAIAFIEAHHRQRVLTTLKHFPGHGSSRADSHLGFVDVSDTWTDAELIPYREVMRTGNADVVMTAHIFNANLDPEFPATLSKRTITGVLREQLGFNGVVMTDDMMMGAIANFYDFEDSVVAAVEAGADIVSVANSLRYSTDMSARTFEALRQAVASGRLTERRIDESYQRIVKLKQRLL